MKIEEKNNLISIIKKYRQILVFEQAIRKLNEIHKQPINSRALIVSPAFKKELDQFVWENNK